MDARFYNSEEIDVERLAKDLVSLYHAQGYQAQDIGTKDQMLVQLKKGGDFEALIGMQAALSLNIQRTSGGVLAMIGQQRWIDKAAVGAVGIVALPILWPLALTAGVGALRQASLGNQVLNMVDGLVRQQRPDVQVGPVPYHLMPQVQQQWAPQPSTPMYTPPKPAYVPPQPVYTAPPTPMAQPAPAPAQLRCTSCQTPYEPGDTFCSGCGRSLTPPRLYCSKCNTELKQGASFCPRCGSSTFHTLSASQQPIPVPAPTPSVSYVQPTPVPPAQSKPSTPVYTPPQQPAKPAAPYYVPSPQPTIDPHAAPTVASQPAAPPPQPKKPVEPYYVPPTTQTPDVVPQPRVTLSQSAPKKDEPIPPPQRPQKQYYVPSNQAQTGAPAAPPDQPTLPTQPTAPSAQPETPYYEPPTSTQPTIPAQPAAQSAEANVTWGTLIFSNGDRVQLKGESASVGRYDHDLGGIQPEVDLSKMQGADTVSRIHAVFEHSGSTSTLTDLNSTNATRINNKRLEPDQATPINDGDTLQFGKITCTYKKL